MSTEAELITLIQELKSALERLSEKQDEMNADIKQIKEAVYNPDSGLYARLRALEQWKETYSKVTWGVMTTLLALVTATVYKMIIGI
jgi:predicted  nucleic acid-binding Zn-ribbon protein|tara:strand:+ start:500 stop:760 length:261 start_codon:yes stop_codon:yes gene_type:complete